MATAGEEIVVVNVETTLDRSDRFQMRRLLCGRLERGIGAGREPPHSHVPVAPWLRRRPFDRLGGISTLARIHCFPSFAARTAEPSVVDEQTCVTTCREVPHRPIVERTEGIVFMVRIAIDERRGTAPLRAACTGWRLAPRRPPGGSADCVQFALRLAISVVIVPSPCHFFISNFNVVSFDEALCQNKRLSSALPAMQTP